MFFQNGDHIDDPQRVGVNVDFTLDGKIRRKGTEGKEHDTLKM